MDIRKLQRAIVDGLEDVKAQHIVVFNTEHLSPLFERVIIASGTSNRQTKALASSVKDAVRAKGFDVSRVEGSDNGEWIIVDCGAAVCHIMQPAIREYYHLEEIWGGKPVKIKLDGQQAHLPKASEEDNDVPVAATVKAAAKKAPAKKTPAAKAPAKKVPAKKATAKKAPAKKVPAQARAGNAGAPKKSARTASGPSTRGVAGKSAEKTASKSSSKSATKPAKTQTASKAGRSTAPAKKPSTARKSAATAPRKRATPRG